MPIESIARRSSTLHTDVPGRVDKATVLQALQSRGESYDRVRETLKHVSVDASGKVELEDWVEVRHLLFLYMLPFTTYAIHIR
jgi:plastin-1